MKCAASPQRRWILRSLSGSQKREIKRFNDTGFRVCARNDGDFESINAFADD